MSTFEVVVALVLVPTRVHQLGWRMENGEWRMWNGEQGMESGEWGMENGDWGALENKPTEIQCGMLQN